MAAWTDIETDSLLPGEPWTSAKALAAFENPVALAEGAAGAPKLQKTAFGPKSVNENALNVEQFSASGTIGPSGEVTVTIPGNLVFFPRVDGGAIGASDIEGVMSGGQLVIRNLNSDNSREYTVSLHRVIP